MREAKNRDTVSESDETQVTRERNEQPSNPACPVCGGHLIEIRAKLQCSRCHTICETCCEGGPSRREFLRNGTLILFASLSGQRLAAAQQQVEPLRIGLLTDMHYADKAPAMGRHYRETPDKLKEAANQFAQDKIDLLIELGDLIDAAESVEIEQAYLKTINGQFSAICSDRHYVLGNHCVDTLKKEEFLEGVQQANSYYSFDRGHCHLVVLDACFRDDGVPYERKNFQWTDTKIPPVELEWLEADLKSTTKPVVVFAHQRLDVSTSYGVKNNTDVRRILESSGKVLAVFQGHSHQNDLNEIGGIHYCTLRAMVEGSGPENNGYSSLAIDADGTLRMTGFRKQEHYSWPAERPDA